MNTIKYAHTNLIANNWHSLADFYIKTFACIPIYPERDISEPWISDMTKVPDTHLRGIHLRLPGHGDSGPTLEIFQYNIKEKSPQTHKINNFGFGHLAFLVDNVEELRDIVVQNGGSLYGDLVRAEVAGVGIITAIYICDPEGNIIELQSWEKS
ncbi:MAG: VOC family protein [Candidatus Kapabacteria bacterium]|nr:VOC family protein [Candidatus Kapabacteria bacterium]